MIAITLLMIMGAISGVLIAGNAVFGRIFDKRMEKEYADTRSCDKSDHREQKSNIEKIMERQRAY